MLQKILLILAKVAEVAPAVAADAAQVTPVLTGDHPVTQKVSAAATAFEEALAEIAKVL